MNLVFFLNKLKQQSHIRIKKIHWNSVIIILLIIIKWIHCTSTSKASGSSPELSSCELCLVTSGRTEMVNWQPIRQTSRLEGSALWLRLIRWVGWKRALSIDHSIYIMVHPIDVRWCDMIGHLIYHIWYIKTYNIIYVLVYIYIWHLIFDY